MKTCIVTGSVKGIGKSIAVKYLTEGYFVILNYANDDMAAQQLDDQLKKDYYGKYKIIKCDLSTIDNVNDFVEKCLEEINEIDCLVLNAACTDKTAFSEITQDAWNKVMDVNLNMPFFLVQKFSPYIKRENGSIIFIGAHMGIQAHAISIVYGVSKAAVHFLAKSLVKEFAERKITVNVISPSFVDTPWQLTKEPDHRARIESKIALKRFAYPEEIANITYDVSKNRYINGAIINIDGGYDYR